MENFGHNPGQENEEDKDFFGTGGAGNQGGENGAQFQNGRFSNGGDQQQTNQQSKSETGFNSAQGVLDMLSSFNGTYQGDENLNATLADGKEALNTILSAMQQENQLGDFKIIPIDKAAANILYSSIVLAGKIKGSSEVTYSVLVLSATGRTELTVAEVLQKTERSFNSKWDKKAVEAIEREIAFPIDTFDVMVHKPYAEMKLREAFPDAKTFRFVNINVFESSKEFLVESLKEGRKPSRDAISAFKAMYNPIIYTAPGVKEQMDKNDLSLVRLVASRTKVLHRVAVGANPVSGKYRSDVTATLIAQISAQGQQGTSINSSNPEKQIVSTDVYLAPTFTKRIELDPALGRNVEVNRIQPVLVISNIDTVENTVKFVSAGVIAALPMLRDNMYPFVALKSPETNNWGALSVYEGSDAADYGSIIDLKSPEFAEEEVVSLLDSIVAKNPDGSSGAILAIDIPQNTGTFGLAAYGAAASTDLEEAVKAGKAIIRAYHELTNGAFPLNFPAENIFTSVTTLPEGYFVHKVTGQKIPLATYDITNLISAKVAPEVIYAFNMSEFNDTKIDSYATRLDALNRLGVGSAVLTGKVTRAFFSEAFIKALESSIRNIGLMIGIENLISRANIGKFDGMTGYTGLGYGYTNVNDGTFGGAARFNHFAGGRAARNFY